MGNMYEKGIPIIDYVPCFVFIDGVLMIRLRSCCFAAVEVTAATKLIRMDSMLICVSLGLYSVSLLNQLGFG